MKVTIIGYSGGGKTTLAKRISKELNIPHQQIDRIWFGADGHKANTNQEKEAVRKIIKREVLTFAFENTDWVSDGFYSRVQDILADKADYVVVIEIPLYRRLFNHWKRIICNEDRHPEITKVHDFLHSYEIIKRTYTFEPKLELFKERYHDKLVVLRSYKAVEDFLKQLIKDHKKS